MKFARTLLFAAAVLLLAGMMSTTATAALDPDNDSFGVYFDLAGNTNTTTPMTTVTKTCYILLMNPTTQIKGFEIAYEIVPEASMAPTFADDLLRTSQAIAGGSFVDVGISSDPIIGDFRCGYAAPRAPVPAMLMVTWKFRYYGEADLGMQFFLSGVRTNASPGSNGFPVVDGGSGIGLRQAGVFSGSGSLPVACTGSCGSVVAEETSSFGSVKSLFR